MVCFFQTLMSVNLEHIIVNKTVRTQKAHSVVLVTVGSLCMQMLVKVCNNFNFKNQMHYINVEVIIIIILHSKIYMPDYSDKPTTCCFIKLCSAVLCY